MTDLSDHFTPNPLPSANLLFQAFGLTAEDALASARALVESNRFTILRVSSDVAEALRQGLEDANRLSELRAELEKTKHELQQVEQAAVSSLRKAKAEIKERDLALAEYHAKLQERELSLRTYAARVEEAEEKLTLLIGELEDVPQADQHETPSQLDVARNAELAHLRTLYDAACRERDEYAHLAEVNGLRANKMLAERDAARLERDEVRETLLQGELGTPPVQWTEVCSIAGIEPGIEPWKALLDLTTQRDHHRHSLRAIFQTIEHLPEFEDLNLRYLASE